MPGSRAPRRSLLGRWFRACLDLNVLLWAFVFHGVGTLGVIPPNSATELRAMELERAAEEFFARHPDAKHCSIDGLVKHGLYDGPRSDSWDQGFRFECTRGRVRATSAGADGHFGTYDDVRSYVPPVPP